MEFDPIMITGDPSVDLQHREFFSYLQKFHDAFLNNENGVDIRQTLSDLIRFADFHFKSEEALMQSAHYPGLQAHRGKHLEISQKLHDLHQKYLQGKTVLTISIVAILSEWVADHVTDSDKPMVQWIRTNEPKTPARYQIAVTQLPQEFL